MVRFKVTGDYTCMGDQTHCHMVIDWFDSLHLCDWILCEMYPQNARDMSSWHQSMHGHWHAGTGHIFEHVVGFLSPLNWWSFLSYDKRHAGGFWAVICIHPGYFIGLGLVHRLEVWCFPPAMGLYFKRYKHLWFFILTASDPSLVPFSPTWKSSRILFWNVCHMILSAKVRMGSYADGQWPCCVLFWVHSETCCGALQLCVLPVVGVNLRVWMM